jgi:hypothetical protein
MTEVTAVEPPVVVIVNEDIAKLVEECKSAEPVVIKTEEPVEFKEQEEELPKPIRARKQKNPKRVEPVNVVDDTVDTYRPARMDSWMRRQSKKKLMFYGGALFGIVGAAYGSQLGARVYSILQVTRV